MLSKEIKDLIFINISSIYSKYNNSVTESMLKDRIELFSIFLDLSKFSDIEQFKNIEEDINELFEKIKNAVEIETTSIMLLEPMLKFAIYVIDKSYFNTQNISRATLGILYGEHNINRTDDSPRNLIPCQKAYKARNTAAHENFIDQKFESIMCMIYTILEVIYRYKSKIILQSLNENSILKKHINSIVQEYEQNRGEHFRYIPLNVDIFENDSGELLNKKYGADINKITFEKISEDIDSNDDFNIVKLIGFAGMGKTTTIENVVYNEAVKLLNKINVEFVPIIIPMIQVEKNSQEYEIKSLIAKSLKLDNTYIVDFLLNRNMVKIYLDGINEIRISDYYEKRAYLANLEKFIIKEKNLKVIITDRDSNENSILNNYPTIILKGVSKENIEKFIFGNSSRPEYVNEQMNIAIEDNPDLINTLKNPFMLKNLIAILECNKKIPKFEDEIAEVFLKSIVDRERVIKRDEKAPYILRLLIYLVAKDTLKKDGEISENMVMGSFELFNIFDEFCDKYKRNNRFDNDEMLDLIVKLGILKQIDTEKYTFVDNRYYNFFYFSADELGLL